MSSSSLETLPGRRGEPGGEAAQAAADGSPMRLSLVITTLAMGGAERVLSTMASYWASRGWQITLITLDSQANDFFPLHPDVRRVALEVAGVSRSPWGALRNNLRRVRVLRRAIRASRPEAVISFTDMVNVLTLLATRALSVPVIVSERFDPGQQPLPRVWKRLRRMLYPRADGVVVQTEAVRRWAAEFVPPVAIRTIPNPVAPAREGAATGDEAAALALVQSDPRPMVVAMGRLSPEKGYDLLLRAFARCRASHPGWQLLLLGDGPERGRLEVLARELGIADAVRLPGRVAAPESVLRRAELFVVSSHFEGFPNALLEAMACGRAVISTDCPSGPRQIVRQGSDGLLVPLGDVDALAAAMQRLMADPEERARLGSQATAVRERFALERIMGEWEQLLADVRLPRRGR